MTVVNKFNKKSLTQDTTYVHEEVCDDWDEYLLDFRESICVFFHTFIETLHAPLEHLHSLLELLVFR